MPESRIAEIAEEAGELKFAREALSAATTREPDLSFSTLAEPLLAEDWDCPEDATYDDLDA